MDFRSVILAPIQSEKSYSGLENQRYAFKVHPDADKVLIRKAVESVFGVTVTGVNTSSVKSKPRRRGLFVGRKPGYKKAIVQLKSGDSIKIFEGVH